MLKIHVYYIRNLLISDICFYHQEILSFSIMPLSKANLSQFASGKGNFFAELEGKYTLEL
jgi:hypothetical protein